MPQGFVTRVTFVTGSLELDLAIKTENDILNPRPTLADRAPKEPSQVSQASQSLTLQGFRG